MTAAPASLTEWFADLSLAMVVAFGLTLALMTIARAARRRKYSLLLGALLLPPAIAAAAVTPASGPFPAQRPKPAAESTKRSNASAPSKPAAKAAERSPATPPVAARPLDVTPALTETQIRTLLLPSLERAKTDAAFRREMGEKIQRVCGQTFGEVCFEALCDVEPGMIFNNGIVIRVRKQLKLDPLTKEELSARRDKVRARRDAGGNLIKEAAAK